MIKVGITGGIGSGKSVVSKMLQIMGYPVYLTDDEAKRLMQSDPAIRTRLVGLLGSEVYSDGLNRKMLADYMFSDPEHVADVNSIVHPCVRADFRRWAERQGADLVFMESAILFEANFRNEVDVVVTVSAPLEVRVARAMKRDAAPRESVMRRIRNQVDDGLKRKRSNFVVENDDESLVLPQLLRLITLLSQNNDYLCPPEL